MLKKNYYRVRAFPDQKDKFKEFMSENYIAIGWPDVGDINGSSKQDISTKLSKHYPELNDQARGLTTGFLTRFSKMNPGDIILIPYYKEDTLVLAEVTEPYQYNDKYYASHTTHRVKIKELRRITVNDIPSDLKKSIDAITTLISLDKYATTIDHLISDEQMSVKKDNRIAIISDNSVKKISLYISNNVSKDDLKEFFKRIEL